MFLLKRIEIENFACFEHLDLGISADSQNPLTVIRAENGSGKTTFLRALRWGFYGEKGLPGDETERFSVHPAWWDPSDGDIETKITVTFETDGGTRYEEGGDSRRAFRLSRSITTISREATADDEPDFQRVKPSLSLLQKTGEGGWEPFNDDPDVIERTVDLLLPWGLRDFFFMDADEATDFVGGREHQPLPKSQVVEKTTSAIDELLGLATFQASIERVGNLQRELQREVSRASGDKSLRQMQEELDASREQISDIEEELEQKRSELSDLRDQHDRVHGDLQQALKDTGAHEQLEKRIRETAQQLNRARRDRKETLDRLSSALEDRDLLAGLMAQKLVDVYDALEPLHQKGLIPLTHISFVRERLNQRECICGESLEQGTPHRRNVEQLMAESVEQEKHSNLLGQLYNASGDFLRDLRSDTRDWTQRCDELRAKLGDLDGRITDLESREEQLNKKVDSIDRDHVQTLKGELDAIETQIDRLEPEVTEERIRLDPLREEARSLDKKIAQRQKREQIAEDKKTASDLAGAIQQALENAYRRIRKEQVDELSDQMDQLFAKMALNVSDEDFGHEEEEKATVRMIADVGIRSVAGSDDQFEIYATNRRGRILPPVEINGASRRVLALSFILALSLESDTEAPLVADSLLNMMSGRVRTNTFRTTVETARQPVLLLTRADLAEPPDRKVAESYSGATYTLTGQWDVRDLGLGGDVVHQTVNRQVAVACACGPRDYCEVCMREGDDARSNWQQREADIQGDLR